MGGKMNKHPAVDRDFIFAELTHLTHLCHDSGMTPPEFYTHLLDFTFASIGAVCDSVPDLMQVIGGCMHDGGRLAEQAVQGDDHAGH